MDIVTSNSKSSNTSRKYLVGAAAIAACVVLVFIVRALASKPAFVVERKDLLVATVEQGDFSVEIRGNGTLVPKDLYWQSAEVAGRVEQIFAKAGSVVEVGDVIAKLNNIEVEKEIDVKRWELEALLADNHAAEASMESELLAIKEKVLNTRLSQETDVLRISAQKELLKRGFAPTSRIDLEVAQLGIAQHEQRMQIQLDQLENIQGNQKVLRDAHQARENKMRNELRQAEARAEALTVRATVPGVIQEMPLELGKSIEVGSNVAKVASQDNLIAQLEIQEIQVREVAIGQSVSIDTRNSKIKGVVNRIDPLVNNGVVTVDVELLGELPSEARSDLSINGVIEITQMVDTSYVQRPVFARSFSDSVLYRLSDNGKSAERTTVQLGQGSTRYIEILSGLQVGDRIIVSDPSEWEGHQSIQVN